MEGGKFYFSALLLCIAMVFVFVVQASVAGFTESFLLNSASLTTAPWTLVTSIFLHGSVLHLLSNIFALGLFGLILEKIIGTKRFLMFFFLTGIIASFVASFFYASSLGASGAIFGVLGILGALRPKMVVWAYGVPMPMFVAVAFWFLLDVAGVFYPSGIGNIAHIAGLFSGIAIGLYTRLGEEKSIRNAKTLTNEQLDDWEEEWM